MAIEDLIIGAESGGNPLATNPYSSATGLGQFTNSTWLQTLRQHRPDLFNRYSQQELLDLRKDPELSKQMVGALASDNSNFLRGRGLEVNPGNIYLAHFAGPAGAASVLGASDGSPVSSVLSPEAIAANPFLRNMTVGDLKAWAARKVGGSPPPATAIPKAGVTAADGAPAAQAPASPFSPGQAASAQGAQPGAVDVAGILKALDENQKITPVEAPKINFPTPPGIARARAYLRAMALRPIGGGVS